MKKLIEITELKVGDVIVFNGGSLAYVIKAVLGNLYFGSNENSWNGWVITELQKNFKKQVEQERWRAEQGCGFEVINGYGQIEGKIDAKQRWHNELFDLGNYFKPGEARKHVEAFKEFFNKIKQDG